MNEKELQTIHDTINSIFNKRNKNEGYGLLFRRIGIDDIFDGVLTPREKAIIFDRFGLSDSIIKTIAKTGQNFGITSERVRQIEMKAIEKLHDRITCF